MAGHSKWSKIKRTKGVLDVRRGKLFSKLSREITIAARLGGGDPGMNVRLRSAIQDAKNQNMPHDNIERAVKKGTGEMPGERYDEIIYEGYGPGGVAMLAEAATDNKNRTAAELRSLFNKNHGNLATSGSVLYLFERKGRILVDGEASQEEAILEAALDAGAEDLTYEDGQFQILTPPDQLAAAADALRNAGYEPVSQNLTFQPTTTVSISDEQTAGQILRLYELLDDHDDTQNVYSNFDLPEELWNKFSN